MTTSTLNLPRMTRPVPEAVMQGALHTTALFVRRCGTDPEFHSFVRENNQKIIDFYTSCASLIACLGSSEKRNCAKKVFHGPTQVEFIKPADGLRIEIVDTQREPLTDEEYPNVLGDWVARTVAKTQKFIGSNDPSVTLPFLNDGEGVKLRISPAPGEKHCIGITHERSPPPQ